MMKLNLISKENAITVLNAFFPEEDWHDLIDEYLDVSQAEGMELLLKEELMEFVVVNMQALFEPEHVRAFCSGLIMGIEVEGAKYWRAELDQVLKSLDSSPGSESATAADPINMAEAA